MALNKGIKIVGLFVLAVIPLAAVAMMASGSSHGFPALEKKVTLEEGKKYPDLACDIVGGASGYQALYIHEPFEKIHPMVKSLQGFGMSTSMGGKDIYEWAGESGEAWMVAPGRRTSADLQIRDMPKAEKGTGEEWTTVFYHPPHYGSTAMYLRRLFGMNHP